MFFLPCSTCSPRSGRSLDSRVTVRRRRSTPGTRQRRRTRLLNDVKGLTPTLRQFQIQIAAALQRHPFAYRNAAKEHRTIYYNFTDILYTSSKLRHYLCLEAVVQLVGFDVLHRTSASCGLYSGHSLICRLLLTRRRKLLNPLMTESHGRADR